jgi:hypothetical protein
LPLRKICETFLIHVDEMFLGFQDKEQLVDVRAACAWPEFWLFLEQYFEHLILPLEKARRWGLVCACCAELRRRSKARTRCPRASRRLKRLESFYKI